MARHSKNATSAPFYSYHERKKIKGRVSAQGVLFCKECLLLNLEAQKTRLEKERQLWEHRQNDKMREELRERREEEQAEQRRFLETAQDLTNDVSAALKAKTRVPQTPEEMRKALEKPVPQSNAEARRKNFWVPENTPSTQENDGSKAPPKHLRCPITETPLKLKQLVAVKPKLASEDDPETSRWLCSISGREISHQKAAVVKTTGQVVLLEYLEKFVFGKKGALTSGVINKEDVVELRVGGTGFSAHNEVEVQIERPNVQ